MGRGGPPDGARHPPSALLRQLPGLGAPPDSRSQPSNASRPPTPRALCPQAARPRTVAVRAAAKRETDPKKRVVITGM